MKLNLKVVFLSCCNLLFLNCMVTSNIAMKLYPESAYFVPLILGIITCLIYLLVPKLIENYQTIIDAIIKAKPAAAKGQYIKSVALTTTMGPSLYINQK